MADFFRPAAKAALWRWRDVIAGGLIALLGIWWAWTALGPVAWMGYITVIVGAAIIVTGIQRGRFRQGGEGPGVVQVIERRLAYFGPLSGGVMDLEELTRLQFDPTGHPDPNWVLTGPEAREIAIPITAKGADVLFDAFSTLPGIRTEKLLGVLNTQTSHSVVIWSRPQHLLH